jgi:uncharacterized protein YjiS (DUF1127 family)
MSALTRPARPVRFAPSVAMIASLARIRRQLVAAWRRRRDVALLASFDDFLLKDMGLNRGDLHDALAEPLWRDPTAVLVRRRRRARTAAAVVLLASGQAPPLVPDPDLPARRCNPPAPLTP